MTFHRYGRRFFEVPHTAVYLLIAANIIVYGVCFYFSGAIVIPYEILFRSGAMYTSAIDRHEYWRLVTHGFLHADILHVTINMFCLALWGDISKDAPGHSIFSASISAH